MPISTFEGSYLPFGQIPSVESIEQDITSVVWNRLEHMVIGSHSLFDGAARDAGNTGYTSVLRPGLLLTKTAAGKFVEWGSVVDFATDKIEGITLMAQKMTRDGNNQDRWIGYVLLGGCVKAQGIIVPGQTDSGIVGDAQETNIRTQLKYAFRFDDDPFSHLAS